MCKSKVEANFLFLVNFYATFAADGVPAFSCFQAVVNILYSYRWGDIVHLYEPQWADVFDSVCRPPSTSWPSFMGFSLRRPRPR